MPLGIAPCTQPRNRRARNRARNPVAGAFLRLASPVQAAEGGGHRGPTVSGPGPRDQGDPDQGEQQRQELLKLAYGHLPARALHIAADLGIADHIAGGHRSVASLAAVTHTQPCALERLLVVLVNLRVLEFDEGKASYLVSARGEPLLTHSPVSIRAVLAKESDERRWQSLGHLTYALATQKSPFEHLFGETFYAYLERDRLAAGRFNAGMSEYSRLEVQAIASHLAFERYKSVLDLGGGEGGLLREIHGRAPRVALQLFEMESVIERLRDNLELSFITLLHGDFFKPLPATESSVVVVKRVIHNWSDDDAVAILRNAKSALAADGTILVIEKTRNRSVGPDYLVHSDLILMAMDGESRARTLGELIGLGQKAGLVYQAHHDINSHGLQLLEFAPARR